MKKSLLPFLFFVCFFSIFAQSEESPVSDALWQNPPVCDRPLQITHGAFGTRNAGKWHHPYMAFDHFMGRDLPEGMTFLRDECGLGGIVCNVSNYRYLNDGEQWQIFVEAVRQAEKAGLRVWIYDEDRYPSLSAGGNTLKGHPELEAQELVFDAEKAAAGEDPFLVRDCFEFTHAANNFAYTRRYPSVFNPDAVERFLTLTHEQYRARLGDELFGKVEAFFTDEPSTNAVNTGLLSEKIRRTISKVIDEPNPNKKCLPQVPWFDDFPSVYQKRYGEDLLAHRASLFTGDSAEDQRTRRQFWEMVGQLYAERFPGTVSAWCRSHGLESSGHTLHEEELWMHVPNDGNKLLVLRQLTIPGMDLTSSRASLSQSGWESALFPCSAGILNGTRRMMTEVSDIDTMIAEKTRANVSEICECAAWQSIWGVTEFTFYYQITDRTPADYRQICDFIGRLNVLVRDAQPVRPVLLYYPIAELSANYLPLTDRPKLSRMNAPFQKTAASFRELGNLMQAHQIGFFTSDAPEILKAESPRPGILKVGSQEVETLVFPASLDLSPELNAKVTAFEKAGGTVIRGSAPAETLAAQVSALQKILRTPNPALVLGTFRRDERTIHAILNSAQKPASLELNLPAAAHAELFFPFTGKREKIEGKNGVFSLTLQGKETVLVVF